MESYIKVLQEENLKLMQRNDDLKKELDRVRKWNDELGKEVTRLKEDIEFLKTYYRDCD